MNDCPEAALKNMSSPFHFEPYQGSLDEWGKVLETFSDREIFQTPAWIRFLVESQRGDPVLAVLKDRNDTVGYFAGMTVRKFGMKILGSPFVGWNSDRMGLRLLPAVPGNLALQALVDYAFRDLGCIHLEVIDPRLTGEDAQGLGFHCSLAQTMEIDLTQTEDELLQNMSSKSARYPIRKAIKMGVSVEEAHDEAFADEYYQQLRDVFAKQSLVPTYDLARVQCLIRHLLPTGNLQLLRVRAPDGRCIATGVFLGFHQYAYFWGNASWRDGQRFCPNELLQWHAIRYWKQRGMRRYDLCGGLGYKRKYGGQPVANMRLRCSRYRIIDWARNAAARSFYTCQRIRGRLIRKGSGVEPDDLPAVD
ncbi:MAG: GNAT family N-acetyltransferase [Thermoguttaceae bacterium]